MHCFGQIWGCKFGRGWILKIETCYVHKNFIFLLFTVVDVVAVSFLALCYNMMLICAQKLTENKQKPNVCVVVVVFVSDQNVLNNVLYQALSLGGSVLPCRRLSSLDEFATSSVHSHCKPTVCLIRYLLALVCVIVSSRSFKVIITNDNWGVILWLMS